MSRLEVLELLRELFESGTYMVYPPDDLSGLNGKACFSLDTVVSSLEVKIKTEKMEKNDE